MSVFKVVPKIQEFASVKAFAEAFEIGEKDLLITDRIIYESSLTDLPVGSVIIQSDYGNGEPDENKIMTIRAKAKEKEYDRVIAIGGGSVVDIGKLLATEGWNDCQKLFLKEQTPVRTKKLVILPTTCGTGSEVTNISVAAFPRLGTKIGLANDALYADDAVLCAELIASLPMKVFMHSSIDALIHAIESYLSPKANSLTEMFSLAAIRAILSGYRTLSEKGADARKDLLASFLLASCQAGIAFSNAGCGLIHAMSYPIGGTYHLPHGFSNYEVMIAALRFYEAKQPGGKFALLLKEIGSLDEMASLIDGLSPRVPMKEYGMTEKEAADFAVDVQKNQQRLLANCYVPASVEDMRKIYLELL